MNAVIYARVSSKEQEQEGFSIPAQLKLLRDYASKNDFGIVEEFVDAETAKATGRTRFGEMLKFLRTSKNCRTVLVEKTDRLYRNLKDYTILEELDVEIHLVKEGQILSKESKSQIKFMHGIQVLMARNYIENLKEEVRKGMLEKAEQGIYPSRPPLGYVNNKAEHTIEVHPDNARIAKRMFELYATGEHSLAEIRKLIRIEFGKAFQKGYIHKLLRNPFYNGFFEWESKAFRGTHDTFIGPALFESVQAVLKGHNRPKYRKHEFAFSGILTCAHDNCTVTAEIKKQKYVYYRCTGYRGKCNLPYVRQEKLGKQLGQVLRDIQIPDTVLTRLQHALRKEQNTYAEAKRQEQARQEQRLAAIRKRMDQAYSDKLDGKISEDFWNRKKQEWIDEERNVLTAIRALDEPIAERILALEKILELANKAYLLYQMQNSAEQGKLLKKVLSNCATDGITLYPTYRKPFDQIFERVKKREWRALRDSNSRPTDS